MGFKIKPFKEVLTLTKEKLDETLAPIRARSAKARCQLETAKLEEELISLEQKIQEACAEKDLDFGKIADLQNEYELTERRIQQFNTIAEQLFPGD